jgi:hypothetical protein
MKLFTKRRMLASAAGSVLLHALAVVTWPDQPPAAPPPVPTVPTVAFETATSPRAAPTRVAIVGPRAAGRGRALAGSNPTRHGSPEHARRFHPASGNATGPGATGAAASGPSEAARPATDDPAAPLPVAPAPAADAVPVETPGTSSPASPTLSSPAPTVDAAEAFDRLVRAQQLRLAKGDGGGLAGPGSGGDGVGLGLTTELSGRHVAESHVVTAPVVAEARPVECELPASLLLSAVVRVLVTQAGSPAVPRMLQPSGQAAFDRCALAYVLAMRFAPGRDANGRPLDVWMNVRVAPVTGTAVGAAK